MELVEISEIKTMGRTISKRVIVNSPRITICRTHHRAMETELEYEASDESFARKAFR